MYSYDNAQDAWLEREEQEYWQRRASSHQASTMTIVEQLRAKYWPIGSSQVDALCYIVGIVSIGGLAIMAGEIFAIIACGR